MPIKQKIESPHQSGSFSAAVSLTLESLKHMLVWRSVPKNIAAGITVALVALPLNLALAIACNLPPSVGLVTGVVAGILGAVLGGSRLQITGPEVALAPITLEIVIRHGYAGLLAATFLAGLMQIGFGALRLGRFVNAIPVPVIGGFLAAVGLLVFDSQLPRLLGLPAEVAALSQLDSIQQLWPIHGGVLLLGLLVCAVVVLVPRLSRKAPAPLVALVVAVLAAYVLGVQAATVAPIDTGALSVRVPTIFGPQIDLPLLIPEAIALALLASIDSLLCSMSIEQRTGGPKARNNQELVAQGMANLGSALFGGMPVAAAVVRSMAAVEAGATTRLAPIVQSLVLLLVLLVLGPLVSVVPLFALAGILLVIGYRLIDWRQLLQMWRIAPFEAAVFLMTAAGILFTDFVFGVAIGIVAALVHFAKQQRDAMLSGGRIEAVRQADRLTDQGAGVSIEPWSGTPGDMQIIHINGPLFFGSRDKIETLLHLADGHTEGVLVDVTGVTSVDVTGAMALGSILKRFVDRGLRVWVSATAEGPNELLLWALEQQDATGITIVDAANGNDLTLEPPPEGPSSRTTPDSSNRRSRVS